MDREAFSSKPRKWVNDTGNRILTATYYSLVALVVVATLMSRKVPPCWLDALLFLSAVAFILIPYWIERLIQPRDENDQNGESVQWGAARLVYLFAFIPAGLALSYSALRISGGGFYPVLPFFVIGGYSTVVFGLKGSILSTLFALFALQAMIQLLFGHRFIWSEVMGLAIGMLVFNTAFLIAKSNELARRETARLAQELEDSNSKLRAYAARVEELAIAEERTRLAREIHDSLGHTLTVVNVQVEAARTVMDSDPSKARAALEAAQAYTRQGLKEVRDAVSSLRNGPGEIHSLTDAFRQLLETADRSGLETKLICEGSVRRLPSNIEHNLLRCTQEAITNTLRHAGATQFQATLDYTDPDSIRLQLRDDGKGSEPHPSGGFGLLGLRERVGHLGGESEIETSPSKGFSIEIKLPLR